MIQSITFGDKNTWEDWKILPTERPVFAPPKQKTTYIDIPGGNGTLDLSESLTGYPIYENRSGTFEFRVMNGYKLWQERYSEIMDYLHGRTMKAILADDPDWFYNGRFSIDSWKSGDTWSSITIGYNVEPYKWSVLSSVDPWLWDPFNFETGIIWQKTFTNISVNSPDVWDEKTFDGLMFGRAPITPIFNVSNSDGLIVKFTNDFLDINKEIYLSDGINQASDFVIYGQNEYTFSFKGIGTLSIEFRIGRL